ncbi:ABC transporter substrate-binding protein [Mediterraneibacter massiliensis]|uniref:ABC transporter substrate-binding protein n=1 Tax=Mediterraneibacter massiliensis TaxID=1720300 RepID=UPI0024ACC006|nr:ABC transporter substrate-binding protein [Mediterraneibacter massiliensis]
MKKRTLAILFTVVMTFTILAGCSGKPKKDISSKTPEEPVSIQNEKSNAAQTKYPLSIDIYNAEGNLMTITFDHAPERIVSTQLSITEILLELGLKDKIVGILDNDNAVEDALALELADLNSLGYKTNISKEAILAAEPDIVMGKAALLFTEKMIGTVEDYQELDISVYTQLASANIPQTMDNIIQDIRNIGMIFDVQEKADAYAQSLQKQLDNTLKTVSSKTAEREKMKVLLMCAYQDGVFSAFSSAMHSAMLEAINAENVLDQGGADFTLENLITLNPDAIIYITADRFAEVDTNAIERLLAEEIIQSVPAIANEKILKIGYDDIMDFGVRNIDTIDILADFLYEY